MTRNRPAFMIALLLWPVAAPAAQPPMERRPLSGPESSKAWAAAESSIEASTRRTKSGPASLHWHVDVDYFAGEAKYPVGWPRASLTLRDPALRDWSGWDFLSLRVFAETSREALPQEPVGLGLQVPDKANSFQRSLAELKKGEWVEIRIPVEQIPRAQDVRQMQFHISESRYKHGDKLDLYFDEIAVVRHAEPTLADFSAESAVMYADAKHIPARFRLLGVPPGKSAQVACELRSDGRVAARATAAATRGTQRVVFDVGGQRLAPGQYELSARVAGGREPATAQLRLVESPWK